MTEGSLYLENGTELRYIITEDGEILDAPEGDA